MDQEFYDKMCDYFDGKMSKDEQRSFLEMVHKDPVLLKEFEWEEKMIYNAAANDEDAIKYQFIQSDGVGEIDVPEDTPPIPINSKTRSIFANRWAVAATILLLIGLVTLVIVLLNRSSKQTEIAGGDSTVKKATPKDSTVITPKVDIASLDSSINKLGRHQPDYIGESPLLAQVQEAYSKQDYVNVVHFADNISDLRGSDPYANNAKAYAMFHKAIGEIEQNKDSLAVASLNEVIKKRAVPGLVQEAQWNLCKALFKSGKKEEASRLLGQLLAQSNFKFRSAGEKLQAIINKH
ncbi:MAG TPA: hypothetical protein VKH37_03485 [Ferruginibacter sp.]|nr:hypothetical protein [Ferruginibacter sp.]